MSFLSDAFGRAIRSRRKVLRIKQATLAARLNTEPPTISRWENGEFIPANSTIDEIPVALEMTAEEFLRAMLGEEPKLQISGAADSARLALISRVLTMNELEARGLLATLEAALPDLSVDNGDVPVGRKRR